MKLTNKSLIIVIVVVTSAVGIVLSVQSAKDTNNAPDAPDNPKPSLTVTTEKPQITQIPDTLNANGNIAAWQEAVIGNETDGLRLSDVKVNVGDHVKKGQVLATFASDTLEAELTQINAKTAEAQALYADAIKNAARARGAKKTGAWSELEINRHLTEEKSSKARLEAQQASAQLQLLRIKQAQVLAPDYGIISSRSATAGAVLPIGQELFRLIRQNRLEWRAEVASDELTFVKPGGPVQLTTPNGNVVKGTVRMIAPTVDLQNRLGLVYVDLPVHPELKAGMFVKGKFILGNSQALTVSQEAIALRDGFSYVFKLNADNRAAQVKIKTGRRYGDRVEILEGLQTHDTLVNRGTGFLNDGDLVQVVGVPPAPPKNLTPQN